jgi:transketolase
MNSTLPRDQFIDVLIEEARHDPNVYLLSIDMGSIAVDKFREEHPNQFIYPGIAEQNAINVAAGLAASGKKVYVIAMAAFITARCYEQIRYSVAMMNLPMTLLGVGVGFGYNGAGPAHYTTDDIGLMRLIHGMEIWNATDGTLAREIARVTLAEPALRYVRLEREALNGTGTPYWDVSNGYKGYKWCKSHKNIMMVSSGYTRNMVNDVIRKIYEEDEIPIGHIEMVKVWPPDEYVLDHIGSFDRIIVVEEQSQPGATASILSEKLGRRIEHMGAPDKYVFENGRRDDLHKMCGFSPADIEETIRG